ncbi:hypothetical protein AGOR_G00102250 [Albula goreensis]|uniref:Saposin B-type domain-containing protein n=1 Tax=Albula goreensis TaxID=1534307 RepID=A0A8T3DI06_9TELE|nr:hypothetical protein AGOR_G00102250 [Albula goreensis]
MRPGILLCLLLAIPAWVQCGRFDDEEILDTESDPTADVTDDVDTYKVFALCGVCKRIMENVKSRLSDNASKEEIMTALNNVCDRLPKLMKGTCKKVVRKYLNKLADELSTDDSPRKACVAIKLCKPKAFWELE